MTCSERSKSFLEQQLNYYLQHSHSKAIIYSLSIFAIRIDVLCIPNIIDNCNNFYNISKSIYIYFFMHCIIQTFTRGKMRKRQKKKYHIGRSCPTTFSLLEDLTASTRSENQYVPRYSELVGKCKKKIDPIDTSANCWVHVKVVKPDTHDCFQIRSIVFLLLLLLLILYKNILCICMLSLIIIQVQSINFFKQNSK